MQRRLLFIMRATKNKPETLKHDIHNVKKKNEHASAKVKDGKTKIAYGWSEEWATGSEAAIKADREEVPPLKGK